MMKPNPTLAQGAVTVLAMQSAFMFLIDDMSTDDALDCGRYEHRDCLWGAIAALNGLAALPTSMHSVQSKHVVEHLAKMLLDYHYDFEGEHKPCTQTGNCLALLSSECSRRTQPVLTLNNRQRISAAD